MLLAETVATVHAVFSKQMLLPARWNDVAFAGTDTRIVHVLSAVAISFLLSCFSGLLLDVHKQTIASVMFLITFTALML